MEDTNSTLIFLEQFHHIGKVQDRPADPVKLVYDHFRNLSLADVRQELLQLRPYGILPAVAFVFVLFETSALEFILAELNLALNRDTCPAYPRTALRK